jgi:hypothetical protein
LNFGHKSRILSVNVQKERSQVDALLWKRIGELFEAARALEGQERLDYLRERCGSDKNLLDEVLSLLYAEHLCGHGVCHPGGWLSLASRTPA